jgi:hypothetical protein
MLMLSFIISDVKPFFFLSLSIYIIFSIFLFVSLSFALKRNAEKMFLWPTRPRLFYFANVQRKLFVFWRSVAKIKLNLLLHIIIFLINHNFSIILFLLSLNFKVWFNLGCLRILMFHLKKMFISSPKIKQKRFSCLLTT